MDAVGMRGVCYKYVHLEEEGGRESLLGNVTEISGQEWLVGTKADLIKQQRMALIILGLSFTQS